MASSKNLIYTFDQGDASMRDLLGGKGAGLSQMTKIGLPVPPGFVITTEACLEYFQSDGKWPANLWKEIKINI